MGAVAGAMSGASIGLIIGVSMRPIQGGSTGAIMGPIIRGSIGGIIWASLGSLGATVGSIMGAAAMESAGAIAAAHTSKSVDVGAGAPLAWRNLRPNNGSLKPVADGSAISGPAQEHVSIERCTHSEWRSRPYRTAK